MKWEKDTKKSKHTKRYKTPEKTEDSQSNKERRQTTGLNQFNTISRQNLRRASQHEGLFQNYKYNKVLFSNIELTDPIRFSLRNKENPNEHIKNINPLNKSNIKNQSQILSVKREDCTNITKLDADKDKNIHRLEQIDISPVFHKVNSPVDESSITYCNKSFQNKNINTDSIDITGQYTPILYKKSRIISLNNTGLNTKLSENSMYFPERSPTNRCRIMSLSQLKTGNLDSNIRPKHFVFDNVISEKQYQIKKYRHLMNYRFSTNPKIREEAAKLIQGWLKKIKHHRDNNKSKIIKIQAIWRGYIFRKQLCGLISLTLFYQSFCDKIYYVLRNYVWRNYFKMMLLKKKKVLFSILNIKYKQYCKQWMNKAIRSRQINEALIRLLLLRNRNYNYIQPLKAYYRIWMMTIRNEIMIELKDRLHLEEKLKLTSLTILLCGLGKLGKRKSLKIVTPPIGNYLQKKAKMIGARIIMKSHISFQRKLMKINLIHWRKNSILRLYLTIFAKIRTNRLSGLIKQRHKIDLKCSFDNMKLGLIKDLTTKIKKITSKVIIPTAINHLRRFAILRGFKNIKSLLSEIKAINIITRNIKAQFKRNVFMKYSRIIKKLRNNDRLNKLLLNHFNRIFRFVQYTNRLKYFSKWKAISQVKDLKYRSCGKYAFLIETIRNYSAKSLIDTKVIFIKALSNHVHNNRKRKLLLKLIGNNSHYVLRNYKNTLHYWYKEWIRKAIKDKMNHLKGQIIKSNSMYGIVKVGKGSLSKAFNHWKITYFLFKANDQFKGLKNIIEAVSLLHHFKEKRIRRVMIMLSKPKLTYLKGKVLSNLAHILSLSNMNLRIAFYKWRIYQMKETYQSITKSLVLRSHCKQMKLIRSNADKSLKKQSFLKYFLRWYYHTIISSKETFNHFITNLNKGILLLHHIMFVYHIKHPFELIKGSKVNPRNKKILCLKKQFSKNDYNILLNAWNQWKHYLNNIIMINLKGKAIYRAYTLVNQKFLSQMLLKKFMHWKLNRLSQKRLTNGILSSSFNHLFQGMIIPQTRYGFSKIIKKINQLNKEKALIILSEIFNSIDQSILSNKFSKWKKASKGVNSINQQKTLLLRNIILKKELFILKQSFTKWIDSAIKAPITSQKIKEAIELTHKVMLKANKDHWEFLNSFVCLDHLSKALKKIVLPYLKLSYQRKLSKCFSFWRLIKEKSNLDDYKKLSNLRAQLNKRKKIEDKCLKKHLRKWNMISKCLLNNIYGQSLSQVLLQQKNYLVKAILIRNITIRPLFNFWKKKCLRITSLNRRHVLFNKLTKPILRKTALNNIKNYFDLWKRINQDNRLTQLNGKYLHLLIMKKEKEKILKSEINYFKKWLYCTRINRKTNRQLPGRLATLINGIKNKSNGNVLLTLRREYLDHLKKDKLLSILSKESKISNRSKLSISYWRWYNYSSSVNSAYDDLKSFFNSLRAQKFIRKNQLESIIDELKVVFAQARKSISDKANIIIEYTKRLLEVKEQMAGAHRTIVLNEKLNMLMKKNQIKAALYLNTWRRIVNEIKINKNAKTIQRFYKSKNKQISGNQRYNANSVLNFRDSLYKIIKNHFLLMKNKCDIRSLKSLVKERIHGKMTIMIERKKIFNSQKLLKLFFKNWKNQIGNSINNQEGDMTGSSPVIILNVSQMKEIALSNRISSLARKREILLKSYFQKWRKIIYYIKVIGSCTAIQKCFKCKFLQKKKGAKLETSLLPFTQPCISIKELKREEHPVEMESSSLIRNYSHIKNQFQKWNHPLVKYWLIFKKKKNRKEDIKAIMLRVINKLTKQSDELTKYTLRKWFNNIQRQKVNYNSAIIQRFLLPKIKKKQHQRHLTSIAMMTQKILYQKLNSVARIHQMYLKIQKKPSIALFNALKRNCNQLFYLKKSILKSSGQDLKIYFKHYMNQIRKIRPYDTNETKLLQLQRVIRASLLRSYFGKIRNNKSNKITLSSFVNILASHIIDTKKCALMRIQRNTIDSCLNGLISSYSKRNQLCLYNYFIRWNNWLNEYKRIESIKKLITNSIQKGHLIIRYMFIVWKRKSFAKNYNEHASNIQSFLSKIGKRRNLINNWKKISNNILSLHKRNVLKRNCKEMRQIFSLKKIVKLHTKRYNIKWYHLKWKQNTFGNEQGTIFHQTSKALSLGYKGIQRLNQINSITNIYKIYIYKILSNAVNILTKRLIKSNTRMFFNKSFKAVNSKMNFSFTQSKTCTHEPMVKRLSFRAIYSNKRLISKKTYIWLILPLLTEYLSHRISKTNYYTFIQIRNQTIPSLFTQLMWQFNKKQMKIHKMDLYNSLSSNSAQSTVKLITTDSGIESKPKDFMGPLTNRESLHYLINITFKHKTKLMMKKMKYILAIWRVYAALLAFKKKKIKIIQQNCVDTYKNLAYELFGQGEIPNPTVEKELSELYNHLN